jgi:hypothetical protein
MGNTFSRCRPEQKLDEENQNYNSSQIKQNLRYKS